MATPDDKLKKSDRLRRVLDFIFGFKNKRGETLQHWIYSAEGFGVPPVEFYAAVEKKLTSQNIPGMAIARQGFSEAGLLSDQRVYFHLMRERLAIDACAAPFGNIYFFSCRTVHVPTLVRLWHILATLAFFGLTGLLLVALLGPTFAVIAQITLVFALVGVLRNAGTSAFKDMDTLLLALPVVSTIYENWFRVDTYYRLDTRELYLKMLPAFIRETAEEMCAEKGVKLLPQYHFPPISQTAPPSKPQPEPQPK